MASRALTHSAVVRTQAPMPLDFLRVPQMFILRYFIFSDFLLYILIIFYFLIS